MTGNTLCHPSQFKYRTKLLFIVYRSKDLSFFLFLPGWSVVVLQSSGSKLYLCKLTLSHREVISFHK